jgi:CheY-like chemotaxis protein
VPESQTSTGGRPANSPLVPKRILIVDDSADVRTAICAFLKQKTGYEIYEAVDGVGAIEKSKKLKPVLVVLDARMPSLNGVAAASIIKRNLRPNSVRIILHTQAALTLLTHHSVGSSLTL